MIDPNQPWRLIVEPPEHLLSQREQAVEQLQTLGYKIVTDAQVVDGTPFHDRHSRAMPLAYEVMPNVDRPTSMIRHIASGEVVEGVTLNDFSRLALVRHSLPNIGTALGNLIVGRGEFAPVTIPEEHLIFYKPKKAVQRALRLEHAARLYDEINDGRVEVCLSKSQKGLLRYLGGLSGPASCGIHV